MSKANVIKTEKDQTFKVASRTYKKLGEVRLDHEARGADDFVPLAAVKELIPSKVKQDEISLCFNRKGVIVYARIK